MPHADQPVPAQVGPRPESAQIDPETGLDAELLALAAPPRAQRWMALLVMAAAVVAMLALVLSLRSDIAYSLVDPQPIELGPATAIAPQTLTSNSYVHLEGIPTVARAVRFQRGLGGTYRVFPLAGQRLIFVQTRDVGGESFARSEFSGRLVTFGELGGRYAELQRVMRREAGLPVGQEAYLLLDGEQPGAYTWTWLVAILCVAFALLDAYFIVRWFKPLRWMQVGPSKPSS